MNAIKERKMKDNEIRDKINVKGPVAKIMTGHTVALNEIQRWEIMIKTLHQNCYQWFKDAKSSYMGISN